MSRDEKERLLEVAVFGGVVGGILGLAAFVLAFVNTGVATVLAIFTCMFVVASCILIGTNLIIKTIEEYDRK